MKTFVGLAGPPVLVWVSEPDAIERKIDGDLAWGDKSKPAGMTALAGAILKEVYGADDYRTVKMRTRFMYRTVFNWKKDGDWSLHENEVRQHIAAIETVEVSDVAPARAIVATDLPPMVHDSDRGAAGVATVWDRTGVIGEKRPGKP